jgi:hypothetical protein
VVAPLAFLRGMLCLNSRYHKRRGCKKLPADGYAHHAYTTSAGPRFRPPNPDDVTIGVLSRLVRALDRAGSAGALPRHLPIYLTEFGIQSFPDPLAVSLARQAEYLGIAEHMAYVNPRVKSFSQYLLRDDKPRKGRRSERYGGFESGLRRSNGRAKPAYDAFRLPLAVEAYGSTDVLWGRVRPHPSQTRVTILLQRRKGTRFRVLRTLTTNHQGVYGLGAGHHKGQHYRVRWTAPGGKVWLGPPIRAS